MTRTENQVRQWLSEAPDFDSLTLTATIHAELQPSEAIALALHAKQTGTTMERALSQLVQAMLDRDNGIALADLVNEAAGSPAQANQEDAA